MENLLNKVIIVPILTIPRPLHAVEAERQEGIKRDAELKLSQQKWEAFMEKIEQTRMDKLINQLAGEELYD